MNRVRKWAAALICFIIMAGSASAVMAAGTSERFIENYTISENSLEIYCSNMGEEALPAAEDFRLTVSGNEWPAASVSSIRDDDLPLTVLCLVDVSGSLKEEQMNQTKEILHAISAGLRPGDNMAIAVLGNETKIGDFMTTQQEIDVCIEGLEISPEDTNLYAGIVDSIRYLQSDSNVHTKRCLVICSDGQDDQKTGITKEEAQKAVTDSGIPVFTLAALRSQPTDEALEYGKVLGSFARASVGGEHFVPSVEAVTAKEAGGRIIDTMNEGVILKMDISGLPELSHTQDILLLRVVYTEDDGTVREDSIQIYSEEINAANTTDTEIESDNTETQTAETEEAQTEADGSGDKKEKASKMPVLLGVFVLVLILIIAAVIVMQRTRKKRLQSQDVQREDTEQKDEQPLQASPAEQPADAGKKASDFDRGECYHEVRLMAVGYSHIIRTLHLVEERQVTIGRNGKADIILDADDSRLSGAHCQLLWKNGILWIRDNGSTNGTFVNGIPVGTEKMTVLRNNDTVRIGSYEYRIGLEEK